MALITIQRNALINQNVSDFEDQSETNEELKYSSLVSIDALDSMDSQKSVNECYFAVRGAAIILPHDECIHVYKSLSKNSSTNDIQKHLQSMFRLLRPEDTLKMAVKLESIYPNRTRYLIIVNYVSQTTEESCLLGIDYNNEASIGLVLPVWADTRITLDGDGGFSITSYERHHIFKPVSVQAMWSALQALNKASSKSRQNNYFEGGSSHSWIKYYEQKICFERSSYNEWHTMDDLINRRPPSPDLRTKPAEQVATEQLIRAKLKEVMMCENLDEVTSKYIRTKIENELDLDLSSFKSFIDEEMIRILGQLDESSQIFDYLYLGSEWNASNFEELKGKGVGKILNVTREIDNFFPGMFDYYNIRVVDDDSTEMLKYWDKTFKYIRKARDEGSKVLVHCKKGISRSASVVLAFVMKETGWKFEEAFEFVKNKRNCIRPNSGFLKQLEIYEGILDASKQRHNSLWRSKSETNLVSKDIRLKRKNNEEFGNTRNRINKQMNDKNDCNKENSNNENFLSIPGSVERPKSWSPEDSFYNETFATERTNVREVKNKRFNARQRFGTDPSCYNIVEAMKNIESKLKENSESDKNRSVKSPRISIVKDRIIDFEAFPQSQSVTVSDALKLNNNSGLVYSLANQFESTHSITIKKVKQKEVMTDLSNIEPIQKGVVQSKPPIPKHQLFSDKSNLRHEPQENCDKLHKNSIFDTSKCPPISPKTKSINNSFDLNKFYLRNQSNELHSNSGSSLISIGSVINTRRKSENTYLKRTNSYDSILKELSLSLFETQSTQRSHQIDSKGHKRSTSLYYDSNKWRAPPQTNQLSPIRKNNSFNDQMDWKYVDRSDRPQSKSMPSVYEAVNEVLCNTREVMNSYFESIPNSKSKTNFESTVLMDYESIEDKNITKESKKFSVFKKSYNFRPNTKTKDSDGVVKGLKEKFEAKVKGNKCGQSCECVSQECQHSQSTPSSPNIDRSERPRSSTLNDWSDGQKGKPFRKTSWDFPIKRIKSQSFETQSNRELISFSETNSHSLNKSNKISKKRSETELIHKSQTQTQSNSIESQIDSRHNTEQGLKRAPPKKLQQGKSHPLTRLIPQNSKFKTSSALLNTM